MVSYQKAKEQVKQTVKIIDPEILMSKATQGLMALSIELGVGVLTHILEGDVQALAGPREKHNPNRMRRRWKPQPRTERERARARQADASAPGSRRR